MKNPPVFDDYLAKDLLSSEEYAAAAKYVLDGAKFFEPDLVVSEENTQTVMRQLVNVHLAPSPLCRAAYTEKMLANAILTGSKQYVILGAGLDTFAWRKKNFSDKYAVFELDHPLTQTDKLSRIKRAAWQMPAKLKMVPIDFKTDSLTVALSHAGFAKNEKSFFSWLGVTYYLSKATIEKTLVEIAALCAYGSTLVFDYPDEGFFTAKERRVQNNIKMAKAANESMCASFSYGELEKLLERCGFLIYELLTPRDITREIIAPTGAKWTAFEHVNYCLAVKR